MPYVIIKMWSGKSEQRPGKLYKKPGYNHL
jgi:hypothetical protein